ncbi:MAG: MOSC domain-containing protein [Chloroflexi bacterium]|nr:MOSC domain-containing protein [Chloroflexota bacterium]
MRIVEIAYTLVKGLGLLYPSQVELTPAGVASNRRFFLVDEHLQMVNGKRLGKLVQLEPELDEADNRLTLRFPDGACVSDVVELGESVQTSFLGRPRRGQLVNGPWAAALSEWAGQPLRLVAPAPGMVGVDRGVAGGVSVASVASLERLAEELGVDTIDRARFRMLFWVDGMESHGEDAWVGREVVLGDAVVRFRGHVGRCVVTSQNPRTGLSDLDTLGGLSAYRDPSATSAPLALGVWGEVASGGRVRIGDLATVRSGLGITE